jgi:hypothetical protein
VTEAQGEKRVREFSLARKERCCIVAKLVTKHCDCFRYATSLVRGNYEQY